MKDTFSVSPAQITIVVVCAVCIYFVIGFYGKSLESYRINQRADVVRGEVAVLEAQNKALQVKLAELSTDGYIETAARDKLNLARPGDHTLIVLPEKPDVAWVESLPNASTPAPAYPTVGHLSDWLALFFGYTALLRRLVARWIRHHQLVSRGDTLAVAVSGGADSVFLLRTLHALAPAWRLTLHVAHFNHGWRGAASDADADFVQALATQLELPFHLGRAAPEPPPPARRPAPEDAARRARYAFLRDVCLTTGATAVAAGHTRDDQVETIFLALLRGSGPAGLGGIAPAAPLPAVGAAGLRVVRPLLDADRAAIREALAALGQDWCEDSTNQDRRHPRNRLRMDVLPILEALSPGSKGALLRAGALSAQAAAFLRSEAERAFPSLLLPAAPDSLALDRRALLALHPALQPEILRVAVERLRGSTRDLEWAHVEGVLDTIRRGRGGAIAWLSPHLRARLSRGTIILEPPIDGARQDAPDDTQPR